MGRPDLRWMGPGPTTPPPPEGFKKKHGLNGKTRGHQKNTIIDLRMLWTIFKQVTVLKVLVDFPLKESVSKMRGSTERRNRDREERNNPSQKSKQLWIFSI